MPEFLVLETICHLFGTTKPKGLYSSCYYLYIINTNIGPRAVFSQSPHPKTSWVLIFYLGRGKNERMQL